MNKLIILILTAIVLSGCKKISEKTQFNMVYDTSVDIPSSTGVNLPFNIFTPDITTNSESTFESNNTRKDLIEQIVLKTLELTVSKPNGEDFSFLKSVEITLKADGLANKKIAWKNNIPANAGNKITLETSPDNLEEYIKKDSFKLNVKTVTDEVLTSDYTIDIHSVFFVDAKILGM